MHLQPPRRPRSGQLEARCNSLPSAPLLLLPRPLPGAVGCFLPPVSFALLVTFPAQEFQDRGLASTRRALPTFAPQLALAPRAKYDLQPLACRAGVIHGFAGVLGGMFPGPHGAVCAALLVPGTDMNLKVPGLTPDCPPPPALALQRLIFRPPHGNCPTASRCFLRVSSLQVLRRQAAAGDASADHYLSKYATVARALTGDSLASPEVCQQNICPLNGKELLLQSRTAAHSY